MTLVPLAQQQLTTTLPAKVRKQVPATMKTQKSPPSELTPQPRRSEPAAAAVGSGTKESTITSDARNENASTQSKILDYEAMKKSARESTAGYRDRTLPGAGRQVTESEKFENAVAQAKRGDCASQHAHLGLLAIPLLLKDTLTETGCKW